MPAPWVAAGIVLGPVFTAITIGILVWEHRPKWRRRPNLYWFTRLMVGRKRWDSR